MIRRNIEFSDRPLQWLLISQIEHARLSAVLAEHCLDKFGQSVEAASSELGAVRQELLGAIKHHDDGWADWDAKPQLDQEHGRPPSFRELPIAVSLPLWTASIEVVEEIGPLAAWIVSGHFMALLAASEKPGAPAPAAVQWQEAMAERRLEWLSAWQALQPDLHSRDLADEALLWLQLFDVMSLWICCVSPAEGEVVATDVEGYHVGEGGSTETKFCYEAGRARIQPWRFDVPSIALEATGCLVPVQEYTSGEQLQAAGTACTLSWQLSDA